MPEIAPEITIEVAYALPDRQWLRSFRVRQGTTLEEAIGLSGVEREFPGIEWGEKNTGVFSQRKPLDYVLRDHDRVEIYRPLIIDPKEARRLKAEKQREKAGRSDA